MVFDTFVREAKKMGLGPGALYMGFDLSTQQLKCLVVDSDLKLRHEAKVDFDADLSNYGIQKGVLTNPAEGEVYAPTAMWLEAVDLVLQRLKEAGLDFSKVRGVSGAGMQHGTVFWSEDAEPTMQRLDGNKSLMEQMPTAFAHPNSPNWQDASTQKQCEDFDDQLGSPETLAEVTGSKAHHRFSGPQILRYRTKYPEDYEKTSRISLVSSFLASVFLGKIAPIDISDVTGMNLWDVHAGDWNEKLLELAAGGRDTTGLRKKLGKVYEDGGTAFGNISSYFVSRYGFSQDCQIIPFTGDNPSTILALPLRASDAMVSLGTSTTFLMSTPQYKPDPAYHFMNHPTTPGLYMFMLCYKNGGLAREHIRDELNGGKPTKDWSQFNETALSTPPLSQRSPSDPMRLGLYFPRPEIVPNLHAGHWRYAYNPNNPPTSQQALKELPKDFTPDDARNIVESQFLSLRLRSQNLVHSAPDPATGKPLPPQPRRVYLVGGGSANPAIARLCAEVLGSAEGVYKLDIGGNACGLGAAYKAVWGCERVQGETFEELIGKRWDEESFVKKVADGYQEGIWERYGEATEGFAAMERLVLDREGKGERQAVWKDGGGVLYDGREGVNGLAKVGSESG